MIDTSDADEAANLAVRAEVTSTLMRDLDDRERLAREILRFAAQIAVDRAASPGGTLVATGMMR